MLSLPLRVFINKRFLCPSGRWCSAAKANSVKAEFLMKLLDIQYAKANDILQNNPALCILPRDSITEAYTLCAENGIDNAAILTLPNILTLRPFFLEQRILFYKELGCSRILVYMLLPFSICTKFTVRDFKRWHLLPADLDVVENILTHVPGTSSDVPQLKSLNDNSKIDQIYRLCMRQFLKCRLEFTDKQLDEKLKSSKLRSFTAVSTLRKAIELLETGIGLPKENIREIILSTTVTSRVIASLSNDLTNVRGDIVKSLWYKRPKLLQLRFEVMQERMDSLAGLGVPLSSITFCPEVLLLSKRKVIENVKEFRSIPELQGYWFHPRILSLIYNLKNAKHRLRDLKERKIRCLSLHLLTCGSEYYNRYVEDGGDKTKGKDLIVFLNYELGDAASLRAALKRHPLWRQIPVPHSHETFHYLKERNYSNDDILKNIHIVLYRRPQIERELDRLNIDETYRSWQFTPSQKLAMCLYNIEKEYHFDGRGAWNVQHLENNTFMDEAKQNPQCLRRTNGM